MKFKKNNEVYESFEDAVNEFYLSGGKAHIRGWKAPVYFYDGERDLMSKAYDDKNMDKVRMYARLMGYEVIEDTPDIREVVEKYGEGVKRKLTRADILHAAEKCVCGQREQDYGTPEDNFETIAGLWETYLSRACVNEAGGVYIDANDVAMMMALLKIARIAAGGGKADSWIDLAGYAACGAECEGVTE